MEYGEQEATCSRCGVKAIHYIRGKTSDCCQVIYPDGRKQFGYVPNDLPGGVQSDCGDYIVFAWCGECGQIQPDLKAD